MQKQTVDDKTWKKVRLDECFSIQQGKQVSKNNRIGHNQRPFLRTANVFWGKLDLAELDQMNFSTSEEAKFTLKKGDLLTCEGGDIGRTAMWNDEMDHCYYQNHLHRLRKLNESIDENFTLLYLEYAFKYARIYAGRANVTTIPNLSKSRLSELEIPLPNIKEQRHIANILTVAQKAISDQNVLLSKLIELKRSIVQQLFNHDGWKILSLENICEDVTVGVVVRPASHYVATGVPAFRSFNIKEDRINENNLVYFSQKDNETILNKSKLKKGDVLVIRTGYPGTACVVPEKYIGANCIDLVIVRPDQKLINSYFLSRFINSSFGKSQVLNEKKGLAQQHFNVGAAKRMQIPIPPLTEQKTIADSLACLDQKIEFIQAKKESYKGLFKTLLHELMSEERKINLYD